MYSCILYLLGYKIDPSIYNLFNKQKVGIFPHTSLCEAGILFLVMMATGMNKKICFAVTHEYMENRFTGFWLRMAGGFPVIKGTKMTEYIIEYLKQHPEKSLAISPEGALSPKEWKSGFFYIAKAVEAPIVTCGIDFSTHTIKVDSKEYNIPSEATYDECVDNIKEMFSKSGIIPLYPENSNPRILMKSNIQTSMIPFERLVFIISSGLLLTSFVLFQVI